MSNQVLTKYNMIRMRKEYFIKGIIIFLSVLCNFQIQAQDIIKSEQKIDNSNEIHLESFSDFPKEIDGCSCYFSISQLDLKNGLYILVNDLANLAFVKIEEKMIRFELLNHDENSNIYHYIYNDYKMEVEIIERKEVVDEIVLIKGKITLKAEGKEAKQEFIGECGC